MPRRFSLIVAACLVLASCGSTPQAQVTSQAPSTAPSVQPSATTAASPSAMPSPSATPLPSPSATPPPALVAATYTRSKAGRRPDDASTENWAGYTATNHGRAFERVEAEWTVVAPSCAGDKASTGIGELVGLNGGFDHPGTAAYLFTTVDCSAPSGPAVVTWQTPNDDGTVNVKVNVGDHVFAAIEIGAQASFIVVNRTTKEFDTATADKTGVKQSQAIWTVLIHGCQSGTCPPLPKFAPITISQALARSNGHVGSIDDPAWVAEREAMSERNHDVIRAQPSSLSASGSKFTVRWIRK